MASLYEYLRDKNARGIPQNEAVQLFLWIYCSTDILPLSLRGEAISKQVLIDTFEKLTRDGLIIEGNRTDAAEPLFSRVSHWPVLVDDFLLNRVALDPDFLSRICKYL